MRGKQGQVLDHPPQQDPARWLERRPAFRPPLVLHRFRAVSDPRQHPAAVLVVFLAAGLLFVSPSVAALLFLAGLWVMAQATVGDGEAFMGWLFLLAVLGAVGAAVGF